MEERRIAPNGSDAREMKNFICDCWMVLAIIRVIVFRY